MNHKKQLSDFPKPSVTVDAVVFGYDGERLSALLLKRKEEPFAEKWTLPGGFLFMQETFEMALSRLLKAKTGLENLFLEQLFTFDSLERDPRDRVLSVSYFGLVNPSRHEIAVGSAASDVRWFPLDALPELGFDHQKIVAVAAERLRSKVQYRPIGFELLDAQFTIAELRRLYETILKKELNRGNFWKKMAPTGLLKPTGLKRTGAQNRAPELFEFDRERYRELTDEGFEFSIYKS